MSRQDEWTRETEAAALERLRAAASAHRTTPVVLVYTRQSVSDTASYSAPSRRVTAASTGRLLMIQGRLQQSRRSLSSTPRVGSASAHWPNN